jgi:outer membrane protein assembly factor BamB
MTRSIPKLAPGTKCARRSICRGRGAQSYQGSWVLGLGGANYSVMGDVLVSHDRQSGRERWRHRLPGDLGVVGGALAAPPAAAGGRIVVATLEGDVMIVRDDGQIAHPYRVGAPLRTQPVVDRGWIYVGADDG